MNGYNLRFWDTAISVFFVYNAIGMIPAFVALLGRYSHKKQIKIILTEVVISLFVLLAFTFFGKRILQALMISQSTVGIAGGLILIVIAMNLLFPKHEDVSKSDVPGKEPFIIPLAIPGLAGPGTIAALTVLSNQAGPFVASAALFVAWVPSVLILLSASFLKKILGEKGLLAVEKLGGMIISFIGIEIMSKGVVQVVVDNFFSKPI